MAGTFGALGRRANDRYGLDTSPFWPAADKGTRLSRYRMSEDMAKAILAILRQTRR
jgi:hypothetical protein